MVIATLPDMIPVADVSNGRKAIQEFRAHWPDITLIDFQMPAMTGLEKYNGARLASASRVAVERCPELPRREELAATRCLYEVRMQQSELRLLRAGVAGRPARGVQVRRQYRCLPKACSAGDGFHVFFQGVALAGGR